jgi:hypothetical protein
MILELKRQVRHLPLLFRSGQIGEVYSVNRRQHGASSDPLGNFFNTRDSNDATALRRGISRLLLQGIKKTL